MRVSITSEVFRRFNPDFRLAVLLVTGLDNQTKLPDSLHLLHDAEQVVRLTYNKDTSKSHHLLSSQNILKYEKGKHYHSAVEKLFQRVLVRKSIGARDVLTNLLQALSLERSLPLGVDDAAFLQGNITFALSKGGKIKKGELYYRDAKEVLGTSLDYWKNSKTALSAKTTSALIHLEAVPPITDEELREVMAEIETVVKGFCGGKVKRVVLERKKRSAIL